MKDVCFVDIETTGLHPDHHDIWEVGLIEDDNEHRWFLPVHLWSADDIALDIGRFHERYKANETTPLGDFVAEFLDLTAGRHLVGAVISFDEERLRRLAWRFKGSPQWHYHLIDVEALMVGALTARNIDVALPWKSKQLSILMGVNPDSFDEHTALGDARWAKACYEAVMSQHG